MTHHKEFTTTHLLIYNIYQQVIESPSKNPPPIRQLQGKTVNNLYKMVTWLIIHILFYSTDTHSYSIQQTQQFIQNGDLAYHSPCFASNPPKLPSNPNHKKCMTSKQTQLIYSFVF